MFSLPSAEPRVPVPLTLQTVRQVFDYLGRPPTLVGIPDSLPGDTIVPVELNTSELSMITYILQQITAANAARAAAEKRGCTSPSGSTSIASDGSTIASHSTLELPQSTVPTTPHNEILSGVSEAKSPEKISAISQLIKPIVTPMDDPSSFIPHVSVAKVPILSSSAGSSSYSSSPSSSSTASASPPPLIAADVSETKAATIRAEAPSFTSSYSMASTPSVSAKKGRMTPPAGYGHGLPHCFPLLYSMTGATPVSPVSCVPSLMHDAQTVKPVLGSVHSAPVAETSASMKPFFEDKCKRTKSASPRHRRRHGRPMTGYDMETKLTVPPDSYVCFKCHCVGHYMKDCGKKGAKNFGIRLTPPKSYRCDLCGKGGHWIAYCDVQH